MLAQKIEVAPDGPTVVIIGIVIFMAIFSIAALIAFLFVRDWARGF